jgi:hypothetical protein
MRWDEPEVLPDLDEPYSLDAGNVFVGLCVVGLFWVTIVIIGALVMLALHVLGWR